MAEKEQKEEAQKEAEDNPDIKKYADMGFKCGIEIHQQLETHKLFCNCQSIVHDTDPGIRIERRLRAAAGETGEVDVAAEHEQKKGKLIKYEACKTSCCLVELDEEPPHDVNEESLEIALQIAAMLNCKIVDEIQVMRKTVVDGSNVSGFQRTAIIAIDGYIDTSLGKVGIPGVFLEEEAAKKITEEKDSITYRLDRLGIPLVEIPTDSNIKTPEHAQEVASKIGMILRSTGKVKRGLGTIRQDVNISIGGGARTEIKGFQDLRSIPKVVENEIKRQKEAIAGGQTILKEVRKAMPDFTTKFLRPMPGAARMYPETDIRPVKPKVSKIKRVELIDDKIKRFEKRYRISSDLAKKIINMDLQDKLIEFTNAYKQLKPAYIADTMISAENDVKSKNPDADTSKITMEIIDKVLGAVNSGELTKEAVIDVFADVAKGNELNLSNFKAVSSEEVEETIKKVVEENKDASIAALMGIAMKELRGKVDGAKVMQLLKKISGK